MPINPTYFQQMEQARPISCKHLNQKQNYIDTFIYSFIRLLIFQCLFVIFSDLLISSQVISMCI